MTAPPTLLWLRRDLRLGDHPGWAAALGQGGPVIPVFVLDPLTEGLGAAPRWRLGAALARFDATLRARASRLILRRGPAVETLLALAAETGAGGVVWSRLYDARSIARDTQVKAALTAQGLAARSVNASLLAEPWTIQTKTGGPYKVYTPFWRAFAAVDPGAPLAEPGDLAPPAAWPASDRLADWRLDAAIDRGAAIVAAHAAVGEAAARDRLDAFLDTGLADYATARDRMDRPGTSRLGENLTWGEISPRSVWAAARARLARLGAPEGGETYLKELVWREFAHHLIYHTPHLEHANWRPDWDGFPWRPDNAEAEAWRRGRTGCEVIDAAMREIYVTGTMHNRARMLVASYLTKHLLTHWRVGADWFAQVLIDWDPASNAMGWQWAAGSGPDAAPYFRVFNPDTQAARYDPDRAYRDRFLAEGRRRPHADALAWFEAIPRSWGQHPNQAPARPLVDLAEGRARALAALAKKS